MKVYKYQGAGNDFILINNLDGNIHLSVEDINFLCDRRYGVGADGLIILRKSEQYDFSMQFFNGDGSSGMMCGNGGRCIVAFAAKLGVISMHQDVDYSFEAPDGVHSASIMKYGERESLVRLEMKDVLPVKIANDFFPAGRKGCSYRMNTGCDHMVIFVDNIDDINVFEEGRVIRYHPDFAPSGINVNFVSPTRDILFVRTYEKGIETETYACGTGVVASAIAAYSAKYKCFEHCGESIRCDVRTLRNNLTVDFVPTKMGLFKNIYLSGPATLVFETEI